MRPGRCRSAERMEKQHVRREVPLWVALTRTVAGRVRVCVCGAETLFDGRMNGRKNAQTSEQNANEQTKTLRSMVCYLHLAL